MRSSPRTVDLRTPLSALFLLALGSGAEAATLTGTVTDSKSGTALAGATVRVEAASEAFSQPTDSLGVFEFVELPAGEVRVLFRFPGYVGVEKTVELAEDVVRLDEQLVKEEKLEEVEVRAERVEGETVQPGYVRLSARDLTGIPAVGESDPIRSLQLLPGVQAASDISSGLYVRGGGPDQTLILLDEVPIYNPTHAFGLFSTFNGDAVDEVTLYKGAYPARYGGRLGSVLDVKNREGDRSQVRGRVALSTITGRTTWEGPLAGGSWILSGRRTYLDPILDALRTETNEIPEYYFYDVNGGLAIPGSGQRRFLLNGYRGRDDLFFDLDEDSFLDLRWGNQALSSTYEFGLGGGTLGRLLVSGSEYESSTFVQVFTTPIRFENELRDLTARVEVASSKPSGHRLRAGASLSGYDFRFAQTFNREQQIDFHSTPFDASVFVEDEWSGKTLDVRGGLRARYFSEGSRFLLEPRLAASAPVAERVRLKVGGGLYHQYLQLISTEAFTAGDFYLPIDETAPPGRSWQAVVGFEWEPSRKYRFSLETYYTGLDDLVLLDNEVPAGQSSTTSAAVFLTDGTGYATGVELFVQKNEGSLTGWVGTALGWTRRTFPELNEGKEFAPKYDRRVDLNVVANYQRSRWRYGAAFVLATGQAFTPATARYGIRNPATGDYSTNGTVLPGEKNSARLLPYHRLDVSVARDFRFFGRSAEWTFQVFNLYSRRNEWFVQFDPSDTEIEPRVAKMLPIIPSLGVSVDF